MVSKMADLGVTTPGLPNPPKPVVAGTQNFSSLANPVSTSTPTASVVNGTGTVSGRNALWSFFVGLFKFFIVC